MGTTSEHGNCPTLYEVVESGDIVVQGDQLTDGEHLAQLRDLGVPPVRRRLGAVQGGRPGVGRGQRQVTSEAP
ncbi:hypothetical protein [Streptomyces sp. NPDC059262]|uniref:hypothetical protein n=1 Tax=Streptomyces sp. NPDC059262 TaxID=3346797 RepID=UPI0036AA9ED1